MNVDKKPLLSKEEVEMLWEQRHVAEVDKFAKNIRLAVAIILMLFVGLWYV